MGNHRLPVALYGDGPDLWQALRYLRTQTHLLDWRRAVPGRICCLGSIPDHESVDCFPCLPGSWRSRVDAHRYCSYWRSVHTARTRQMAGGDRWCFRPVFHPWSDSWWLDYRSLLLALGVLCQLAGWDRCAPGAHLLDADAPQQKRGESLDRLPGRALIDFLDGTAPVGIHLGRFSICLALMADYEPVCWSNCILSPVYPL